MDKLYNHKVQPGVENTQTTTCIYINGISRPAAHGDFELFYKKDDEQFYS